MNRAPQSRQPISIRRPLLLGAIALLPFLLFYGSFRQLFWFGDEFPLMDEIDTQPFSHWLWMPFVENILPLFKLLWGSAVVHGSGSYLAMLWGSWLVHGVTAGLMSLWMRRSGFGWASVVLLVVGFGWSASQIETLTWSVQVSAQLATGFFVAAALFLPLDDRETPGLAAAIALVLLSLASAWSFSRGLLTGPVLAFVLVVPCFRTARWQRWGTAILSIVPCVVTGVLMVKHSPENARHMAGDLAHYAAVAKFALCYLAGSPLIPFWYSSGDGSAFEVSPLAVFVAGAAKLGLLGYGWHWATAAQQRLLLTAILLECGYATLLGLGRSEGGWHYGMSSRYQYNSLLFTLPFAGVVLDGLAQRLARSEKIRFIAFGAAVGILGLSSLVNWHRALPDWVEHRGTANRRWLIEAPRIADGFDLVAVPTFPNWRSKQLRDKYHLH